MTGGTGAQPDAVSQPPVASQKPTKGVCPLHPNSRALATRTYCGGCETDRRAGEHARRAAERDADWQS